MSFLPASPLWPREVSAKPKGSDEVAHQKAALSDAVVGYARQKVNFARPHGFVHRGSRSYCFYCTSGLLDRKKKEGRNGSARGTPSGSRTPAHEKELH